jgi:hypothetical protein
MEDTLFQQYNAFTSPTGNIIWGAAMQLAWNELRKSFASGKPLAFISKKSSIFVCSHTECRRKMISTFITKTDYY